MKCEYTEEDLILLFYDEVDASERVKLEAHIQQCPACRKVTAELDALSSRVPRRPLVIERLRPRRLRMVPLIRWASVAAVVLLAFQLGRMMSQPHDTGAELARVQDVELVGQTGLVRVQYDAVHPRTTEGTVDDADMQQLLGQALSFDSSPLSRMRAARALSMAQISPNPSVTSALEGILVTDPNAATRLHAMKALQQLHETTPLSASLRDILLDLVVKEPNTAIRMRALDTLTRSDVASMELAHVLEVAATDLNPHIRFQAESALVEFD